MSYCRFSSDNWRSDVYVYEHYQGFWQTHVASNRVVGKIPNEPDWDLLKTDAKKWMSEHKAVMDFLENADRKPIGLPHDGESFEDPTLEECRDRLLELRTAGYHVPDHAVEGLEYEMQESENPNQFTT